MYQYLRLIAPVSDYASAASHAESGHAGELHALVISVTRGTVLLGANQFGGILRNLLLETEIPNIRARS